MIFGPPGSGPDSADFMIVVPASVGGLESAYRIAREPYTGAECGFCVSSLLQLVNWDTPFGERGDGTMKAVTLTIVMVIGTALIAYAEGGRNDSHESPAHQGEAHHDNHVAVFLGATHNLDHEQTDFTVGAEYERQLTDQLGLGVFAEEIFADNEETILGGLALYHLDAVRLFAGPGVVFAKHSTAGHHDEDERKSELLLRVGCGYDFHADKYSVTPTLSIDYIDGDYAIVFGVGTGLGF